MAATSFCRKHQAKGREEGRQEGRQEGRAEGLLAVLESRGLCIAKNDRSRILACTDAAQVEAWLRKAAWVASVDDLF